MNKKPLSFPPWLEAAIVLLMLVMTVVEYNHGQYVWAAIFAIAGILFGSALAARLLHGDSNARK